MSDRRVSAGVALGALVVGAVIGGMAVEYWLVTRGVEQATAQAPAGETGATLVADVEQLKRVSPSQSHTMKDVAGSWTDLWFAVDKGNWPLASFQFRQARQSVRWTVLLRPVRTMADGTTFDVKRALDVIDPTAFAEVELAIEDRDKALFADAYKKALVACHSCHVQAGLPFLRLAIPTAPASAGLSFDP
jgi:hypothetical protein